MDASCIGLGASLQSLILQEIELYGYSFTWQHRIGSAMYVSYRVGSRSRTFFLPYAHADLLHLIIFNLHNHILIRDKIYTKYMGVDE